MNPTTRAIVPVCFAMVATLLSTGAGCSLDRAGLGLPEGGIDGGTSAMDGAFDAGPAPDAGPACPPDSPCRTESRDCVTACGSTGQRVCDESCNWGPCEMPAESCNGLDDDCDGMADEGFTCVMGSTAACTTPCDTTGSRACNGSCELAPCEVPAEACNGIDDDCDGMIDESVECLAGAMEICTTSCGTSGLRTCSALCVFDPCVPPAEACNGVDDDCDGMIDEGFGCVPGATRSCAASCGTTGSQTCNGTCSWGACVPPVEICNGADDDCDSMTDEGFGCVRDATEPCTSTCGTRGSRTCSTSCAWGACVPPAEVCNGIDDDCDSMTDEDFPCRIGTSGTCRTTCGTIGARMCTGSCTWPACVGLAETVCDGVDDDCNGTIDDGATCAGCTVVHFGSPAHTYLLCNPSGGRTWAEASADCVLRGYHLVTIDDMAENTFIGSSIEPIVDGEWWTGLTDAGMEGVWRWVETGAAPTYTRWRPPDRPRTDAGKNCAAFETDRSDPNNYVWDDQPCGDRLPYVCEAP